MERRCQTRTFRWLLVIDHDKDLVPPSIYRFILIFLHAGWIEEDKVHLGEELSDVLIYLIRLSDRCHVNLPAAVTRKFEINAQKYPTTDRDTDSEKATRTTSMESMEHSKGSGLQSCTVVYTPVTTLHSVCWIWLYIHVGPAAGGKFTFIPDLTLEEMWVYSVSPLALKTRHAPIRLSECTGFSRQKVPEQALDCIPLGLGLV